MTALTCTLCLSPVTEQFAQIGNKSYFRCHNCEARFLSPDNFLTQQEEHTHYTHHDNRVDDPAYHNFLDKLARPLLEKLSGNLSGLDYGCGPGPALAHMLENAGHQMARYDPFFFADNDLLDRKYDFITCTEVAEHFHNPSKEFSRLNHLLKTGGWMGVMTCFQNDDEAFANWHYRRDPTHVIFYRKTTFEWLADNFGWRAHFPAKDVVLMEKPY